MLRLALSLLVVGNVAAAAEPFDLRDGDVVALVGNTFIEREQRDGFIELALTLAAPEADVSYRNLGWSGDTPTGRARRFFGPTEEGFKHLLDHLDAVKSTGILVSYGTSEAFEGAAGRESFTAGYRKLLDELQKRTPRIVLITAPPLDPAASPAPEVGHRMNDELRWQAGWLRQLAAERGYRQVDLYAPLLQLQERNDAPGPLTDNGVHLTPLGYRLAARVVLQDLGLSKGPWYENLAAAAQPLRPAEEQIRQAIVAKNTLFFHRHRPQNETYLRGFRKHEQGNNAGEIYKFEPLAAEKDREIFGLRDAVSNAR
jgi:lysophospholipase L1-like esterase